MFQMHVFFRCAKCRTDNTYAPNSPVKRDTTPAVYETIDTPATTYEDIRRRQSSDPPGNSIKLTSVNTA